ncbi:putative lysosomal acid phosphatase [Triangularia verruculosa]|uniref:Lysosomal acid phosphatase n=1 Tax=Triangularia verruculosa TaxID=2587418 RepID=A0AAN6XDR4_9PEZI|nr:putative lysosomal acid phosphatase [Triangularia verruculosa]
MFTTVAGTVLGLLAGGAMAETVHGVVVFSRHGDRTTKHYGAQQLTNLGASQNFQVGSDYRARYIEADSPHRILNISEFNYIPSQVYASAPNQGILLNTATAFLQGLYPPLVDLNSEIASQTLNNGSESTSPLNGYQYVTLQGVSSNSPDAIWIKGDDGCPAVTEASSSFETSTEFTTKLSSTKDFYKSLFPVLKSVYDIKSPSDLSYAKSYDIYDLINVARLHNASSPAQDISDDQLFQLRTLADSAEFGYNFNASQPARSIHAQTLSAAVLNQLNKTVTSEGKLKLSLLAGSYDAFLAFFGLTDLTSVSPNFYGLPGYASTMVFELYTPETTTSFPAEDALRVRFLFKNGTTGSLDAFPLFGTKADSLSWNEFASQMSKRAIGTAEEWCSVCASTAGFCAAYANRDGVAAAGAGSAKGAMSNAVAGVVGAVVTLGVVGIVGLVVFLFVSRRRKAGNKSVVMMMADEKSVRSVSTGAGKV